MPSSEHTGLPNLWRHHWCSFNCCHQSNTFPPCEVLYCSKIKSTWFYKLYYSMASHTQSYKFSSFSYLEIFFQVKILPVLRMFLSSLLMEELWAVRLSALVGVTSLPDPAVLSVNTQSSALLKTISDHLSTLDQTSHWWLLRSTLVNIVIYCK